MWNIPETLETLNENYIKQIGSYINSFYYQETGYDQLNRDLRRVCQSVRKPENPVEKLEPYDRAEMLRDIFLWSVCMGYDDIAFVLLLQLKLRTGAALLAAGIAKRVASLTKRLDIRHMFKDQASAYETYATKCIEACHEHNEERSWKMLLFPRSLYGDATYMQVSRQQYPSFISVNIWKCNYRWQFHQESCHLLIQLVLKKLLWNNGMEK